MTSATVWILVVITFGRMGPPTTTYVENIATPESCEALRRVVIRSERQQRNAVCAPVVKAFSKERSHD